MRNEEPTKYDPLKEKSFVFSLRIVKSYQYLTKTHKEYVLSKYLLSLLIASTKTIKKQ